MVFSVNELVTVKALNPPFHFNCPGCGKECISKTSAPVCVNRGCSYEKLQREKKIPAFSLLALLQGGCEIRS